MNLYKATRPDGTDFRTGTVNYAKALETGEVLKHPEKRKRNRPATYFSVSVTPTDCTGMRWPCRLFRVEAVGRAIKNDDLENKRCCSKLRVVEELPAHEALGPQGEEIAALIERCRTLPYDEAQELHAAWDAAWDAARHAAWGAARDAAWEAARDAARGAAWDAALDAAWEAARDAARGAARGAAWEAAWDAAWGAAWGAARDAAWGAARDAARGAALALISKDLITPEQFNTLYDPWRKVMEK